MYIVNNYTLAVIFCVVTMICWDRGKYAETGRQSLALRIFYWDYVIGLLLFSILSAFTLGSVGSEGRSFLPDLAQADWSNIGSALLGGVVFNAANILLAAGYRDLRTVGGVPGRDRAGFGARRAGQLFRGREGRAVVHFHRGGADRRSHRTERTGLPENADRLEEGSRQGDRDFDCSGRNHGFLFTVSSRRRWILRILPIRLPGS